MIIVSVEVLPLTMMSRLMITVSVEAHLPDPIVYIQILCF